MWAVGLDAQALDVLDIDNEKWSTCKQTIYKVYYAAIFVFNFTRYIACNLQLDPYRLEATLSKSFLSHRHGEVEINSTYQTQSTVTRRLLLFIYIISNFWPKIASDAADKRENQDGGVVYLVNRLFTGRQFYYVY